MRSHWGNALFYPYVNIKPIQGEKNAKDHALLVV